MRKSRIKLNEINNEIIETLIKEPVDLLRHLESVTVLVPKWTTVILIGQNSTKLNLDVMFFEDVKDFFLRYAKTILRKSDEVNLYCFIIKGNYWTTFDPPTLIGDHLKTRLRPNQKYNDT